METYAALLAICAGNSQAPVNSPHKGHWRGAWMFSVICVWINGWVNNREAGDLRRYCAHYDVTVMVLIALASSANCPIFIRPLLFSWMTDEGLIFLMIWQLCLTNRPGTPMVSIFYQEDEWLCMHMHINIYIYIKTHAYLCVLHATRGHQNKYG